MTHVLRCALLLAALPSPGIAAVSECFDTVVSESLIEALMTHDYAEFAEEVSASTRLKDADPANLVAQLSQAYPSGFDSCLVLREWDGSPHYRQTSLMFDGKDGALIAMTAHVLDGRGAELVYLNLTSDFADFYRNVR